MKPAWEGRGLACRYLQPHRKQILVKCRLKVQAGARKNPVTLGGRYFGEVQLPLLRWATLTESKGPVWANVAEATDSTAMPTSFPGPTSLTTDRRDGECKRYRIEFRSGPEPDCERALVGHGFFS